MNKLFRPSPVLLAFTLLYVVATALSAARDKVIKIETSLVNLDVVVTLRLEPRTGGLGKEDFDLYENRARREITHIATDELPLRLSLVFDLNVSMESFVPAVKKEATNLLAKLAVDACRLEILHNGTHDCDIRARGYAPNRFYSGVRLNARREDQLIEVHR